MLIYYFLLFSLICSKELFEDYYKEAEKYLENMTLEDKISQMFFPKYVPEDAKDDLPNLKPGGYVLYADHFNHKAEYVLNYIEEMNNISMANLGLPLGLAVDEEGGIVCRVSKFHRESGNFPSPQQIYNESGIEGILKIDQEKRDLLRKFLLNVNLAPVADLSYNSNDYIFPRTIGQLPNITAEYIAADVEGYVNDSFTCCAKHFPGYGNNINTHEDVAKDNRSYETFLNEDFKPFEAAIAKKIPMILVSHNIVKCKDEKYPASISHIWIDILRNYLNFTGIIMTDDLSMQAIQKYIVNGTEAVLAVKAGNDILISGNFRNHRQSIIDAVNSGDISEELIDIACRRIIAWKLKYLLHFNPDEGDEKEENEENKEEEQDDEQKGKENEKDEDEKEGEKGEGENEGAKEQNEENENKEENESKEKNENEEEKENKEEGEGEGEREEGNSRTSDGTKPEPKDDNQTLYIIIGVVGGLIVIFLVVFLIIHFRKKSSTDIEKVSGLGLLEDK